ncbi:MAG: hypothetical protein GX297_05935 [Treponema sp.]|nr:hypothetical protein [Treponema sp.]
MIFEDDWDMLIKSHKYSRKEFINGTMRYYYDKNNNFSRMTRCKAKPLVIEQSMTRTDIINLADNYIKNVWIADWKKHPEKSVCKELKGKKISFESISFTHLKLKGSNSKGGKSKRSIPNLINHVKYLPLAKELLEENGIHTQSRYKAYNKTMKDGTIGVVYQTVSGIAPAGDSNNYVQVTVSRKKYAKGNLGDTVYISVVGTKDIKKSLYSSAFARLDGLSTVKNGNHSKRKPVYFARHDPAQINKDSNKNISLNNRPVNESMSFFGRALFLLNLQFFHLFLLSLQIQ